METEQTYTHTLSDIQRMVSNWRQEIKNIENIMNVSEIFSKDLFDRIQDCMQEIKNIDNIINVSEIFSKDLFDRIQDCMVDGCMMSDRWTSLDVDITVKTRIQMFASCRCFENVLFAFTTGKADEPFAFRENVAITDVCRMNVSKSLEYLPTII